MLAVVLAWGANFAVIKTALLEIPPMAFTALRFFSGAVALLILIGLTGTRLRLALAEWRQLLLVAIVGHLLFQPLFILGVARTTAGNASLIVASAPVLVAALTHVLGWERLRRLGWIGVLVCFAGVALVIGGGSRRIGLQQESFPGDLLMLAAMTVWSAYTVMLSPLVKKIPPLCVTAATVTIGAVGLMIMASPWIVALDWKAVSFGGWAGVIYSGPIVLGLGYLGWVRGVRLIGATRTAVYSNLIPVVAVAIGALWLGEKISSLQAIGAVLVISGLTLCRLGITPRPA